VAVPLNTKQKGNILQQSARVLQILRKMKNAFCEEVHCNKQRLFVTVSVSCRTFMRKRENVKFIQQVCEFYSLFCRSSSVGIVTRLRAGLTEVSFSVGATEHTDRPRGLRSLLSIVHWAFFRGGKAA